MDENLSLDGVEKKGFKYPLNIKQMGTIDQSLKVYMEDYVYTYLYQHGKSENQTEKLAILVGQHFENEDEQITLISGAIEARKTENCGDKVNFTEDSWNHINRQIEMYFKDLCIVGWVHIQPDYGTYLMPSEEAFHKECFKESWQVLFNMDPSERTDAFYTTNLDQFSMRQLRGYFIYYDKNEAMQNYMIDNSAEKRRAMEDIEEDDRLTFGQSAAKFFGFGKFKEEENEDEKVNDRIDAASKIRKVLNRKEDIKMREHRRRQVAFTVACGFVCAMTIGLFGNIITSNTRLKNIESQMVSMKEEYYIEMTKIVEGATTEATAKVFAEQNAKIDELENKADTAETPETTETAETIVAETQGVYEPVAISEDLIADTRYNVYWVEEGDNLWIISTKFYGTSDKVEQIMAANDLSDENLIYYGEKLMIPREAE